MLFEFIFGGDSYYFEFLIYRSKYYRHFYLPLSSYPRVRKIRHKCELDFKFIFIITLSFFVVKQKYERLFTFFNFFLDFFKGVVYYIYMEKVIRQPKQERSNEKKNKIIEASYELFSEIGYYDTNTAEIAKRAGVSTGIVYSYFKDKRDILLYVLKIYIENVTKPLITAMDGITAPVDFDALVKKILAVTIKIHKDNAHLHGTLHALATSDHEVNAEFLTLENEITVHVSEELGRLASGGDNLKEKVHLAMNIIQSFAHEYVFDHHKYIDYEIMKDIVIKTVVGLFAF